MSNAQSFNWTANYIVSVRKFFVFVIPAKAGIHNLLFYLDSRFRRNDVLEYFS